MARDYDLAAAARARGLEMRWSPSYQPGWDASPEAYLEAGVVAWARSRRLLRADDARRNLKAYFGVQHSDPARWGGSGEPRAIFFLSVLIGKQTIFLLTYPTVASALDKLYRAYAHLSDRIDETAGG
jgi:hypothetical protein